MQGLSPDMRTVRRSRRTSTPCRLLVLGILLVILFSPKTALSQEENLEAQRERTESRLETLNEQIERNQNRLEQTEEEKQASQEKLENLQREIALREELVATYQQRLDQLEQEREQLRDTLQTLEQRLNTLRAEYQDRVVHAYKYARINDLALILASSSINQMLVRIRYLQRFASERREQRATIQEAADEVRSSRQKLAETREETQRLLADARTERENLRALEEDRRAVIKELRARETQLQAEIKKKQKQAQQLEEQIQELVARLERRAARESPQEQAERAAVTANLSASFEQNRGQLPWPAEGAVTEGYGNQTDPVHGTSTYHPGILIATNPESEVQAVFEGTVSGIDFVPGYGTYVVIRHGNYMSVYSNFSTLYISQGDTVEAGEVIGLSGTDDQPRGAGIFFAVFAENESVDPTNWLASR